MNARNVSVFLSTLLAACGGVYSTHAASEETATRHDDRLVGFWRVDVEATPGAATDPATGRSLIAIGRLSPQASALHLVTVALGKDDTIESGAYEVWPTTIAAKDYASVHLSGKGDSCLVLRYEVEGADMLRVLSMEESSVAADVRAGEIADGVAEAKPPADPKGAPTVTLTAPTGALRAYLEKRGDGIYRRDRPLVLRRLRLD